MHEPLKIRNIELGTGKPKICVPLTGKTKEELCHEVKEAKSKPIDLVEWRVDCFEKVGDWIRVEEMASILREQLGETPMIFTCRTEDGQFHIEREAYQELNKRMIGTGLADLIDVELFMGDSVCRDLVEFAHSRHVYVIISNHEFSKTPDVDVLVRRLQTMSYLGGDIPKIAVMPQNPRDVLKLLQATDAYNQWYGDRPIITMSMGKLGVVSRMTGEVFGSCLTFAAVAHTSAPGQIPVDKIANILEIFHD